MFNRMEIIGTSRLQLRPFNSEDAPAVYALASEYEIAANTLRIPHPYELDMAKEWIAGQAEAMDSEKELTWAITLKPELELIGSISLILIKVFDQAELGYWIGKPFWNNGYASEAASAVLHFGFDKLGMHRIHAHHLTRNQGSGKVLQKIGMRHEGTLRDHIHKWGKFEDIEMYGILRKEYQNYTSP